MRGDHVEVALVDGNVDRLANRAAGMVQPWDRIGELHKILEIAQRSVSAPAFEITHERRAVGGSEDHAPVANLERAFRIAGVLDEGRRRGFEERTQEANRK